MAGKKGDVWCPSKSRNICLEHRLDEHTVSRYAEKLENDKTSPDENRSEENGEETPLDRLFVRIIIMQVGF